MASPIVASISLSLFRGETVTFGAIHRVNGNVGAAPEDITGWTIILSFKSKLSDADATEITCAVTNPTGGAYDIPFVEAHTEDYDEGDYEVDIWRTDTGFKECMGRGTLSISERVRD